MRISDWSSDVCSSDLLLHLLDQARFGVARWRLRLVALDLDTGLGGRVALCHRGQQARVLVVRTVIATFVIKGKEAGEFHDLSRRAHDRLARAVAQIDAGAFQPRRRHLARERALPNQLVKPPMVAAPRLVLRKIGDRKSTSLNSS